jgi:hypothetical protein
MPATHQIAALRRGIVKVRMVHASDCKGPLGSHLDRHANIGEGHIGREGVSPPARACKAAKPFILETNVDEQADDRRNVEMLKKLAPPKMALARSEKAGRRPGASKKIDVLNDDLGLRGFAPNLKVPPSGVNHHTGQAPAAQYWRILRCTAETVWCGHKTSTATWRRPEYRHSDRFGRRVPRGRTTYPGALGGGAEQDRLSELKTSPTGISVLVAHGLILHPPVGYHRFHQSYKCRKSPTIISRSS